MSELVFIDESGINLAMTRRYARSPRGTRAIAYEPKQRAKNHTVMGAMGVNGMILAEVIDGGMKKPDFIAFMTSLFERLKRGQCVVLDNLRSHHAAEIKDLAKAAKIGLIYLPPYSPDLNPIEEAWSKFKAWLRKRRARVIENLMSAAQEALSRITPADVLGWTRHAGYRTAEVAQHG